MQSEPGPGRGAIEAAARTLAILYGAIAAGPVVFGVVVAAFVSAPAGGSLPRDLELVKIVSLVHGALVFSAYGLLSTGILRQAVSRGAALDALAKLRAIAILNLTLAEGAALAGWVAVFLAKSKGVLADHPVYWANGASTLLLLGYAALTFPTAERLERSLGEMEGRPS